MSETTNIKPVSCTGGTKINGGQYYSLEKAYDGSTSTYARVVATSSYNATSTVYGYYMFSFNSLPKNSEITGITLCVYGYSSNSSSNSSYYCHLNLYDDYTLITYNKIDITGATAKLFSSDFTESEINSFVNATNPMIGAFAYATKNYDVTGYLCEIYLIVDYEVPESHGSPYKMKIDGAWQEGDVLIKTNGSWVTPTAGYVKVNGNWEEVT